MALPKGLMARIYEYAAVNGLFVVENEIPSVFVTLI